jgi:CubicO group peptidase (beta-lactamase class C family)
MIVLKHKLGLLFYILILNPALLITSEYSASLELTQQENTTYWPTDSWRTSTLQEQDMNVQRIENLASRIADGSSVYSLIIIRNGYIVYEAYRQGKDVDSLMHIFSCTKSFISALVGIALREGLIDSIDDSVLPYFPNWTIENVDERKERLTIRHLLTMTPGLDWNEHNISYSSPDNMVNRMLSCRNPAKYVLDLKMTGEPGLDFVYSTGASQVLSALMREVTGQRPYSYAKDHLFNPLSFSDVSWALVGGDTNLGGSQLYITSRDMARFGYLYLRNGTWINEQIIPYDYLAESRQPLVSTYHGHYYGLHWWVDVAHEYFCALGSQGQGIFVDYTHDLIMVVTGGSDSIPMEVYFENYVQKAASEGYTGEGTEETDMLQPDFRNIMLLVLLLSGGVAIILVIVYPKIHDCYWTRES